MTDQPFGYDDPGDTGGFQLTPAVAAGLFYNPARHLAHAHPGLFGVGVGVEQYGGIQQQTAGLAAQAAVSGQSIAKLRQEVRGLAQDFPIGIAGGAQYVGIVTQLGVASSGSEGKVGSLAKVLVELNAATGTAPAVALGFGQLNRQLASLDPQRVRAFADSLTVLQAKGGGSAAGIVEMSRAIAPFAAQAGIGEAAVLGIASSFTKLGDEGASAATAVGRVLSDISRSVKTGSSDLAAYANVVGMTTRQFRELYMANPTGALERVVGALGSGGGQAAEFLSSRGLDGVRAQRALLQLAQSGQLQQQIQTSIGGYGSGATHKAAAAAFDTLDSSLTKVKSTAGEATAALGGPFAHVLSFLANTANTLLKPVANVLNSRGGQIGLDVGVGALAFGKLGVGGVLRGLTGMSTAAIGAQLAGSGPVASAVAGLRNASGAGLYEPGSLRGQMYNEQIGLAADPNAELGRGPMDGVNRGIYNAFYGFNQGRGAVAGASRRSLAATLARRGVTAASGATATYFDLLRVPFHLAFTPPADRQYAFTQEGGATRAFGAEISAAVKARDLAGAGKALRDFEDAVGGTGKAAARVGKAFVQAGIDVVAFSGRVGMAGGRALAATSLGQSVIANAPVAGLAAVSYLGYQAYKGQQSERAQVNANTDIYGEFNKLRDGLGLAGEAALTFADQAKAAAANLPKGSAPTSVAAARTLTPGQIAAAGTPDSSKRHTTFRGTPTQIAAQIAQIHPGGLQASDLYAVGTELYQQGFSQTEVNQILGQVDTSGKSALTGAGIQAALAPASAAAGGYSPSLGQNLSTGTGALYRSVSNSPLTGKSGSLRSPLPDSHGTAWSAGKNGIPIELGKTATAVIDRLVDAMGQQYQSDMAYGGALYAEQRKQRTANAIMQQALADGQPDVIAYTAQKLSKALAGSAIKVDAADVAKAGGNIVQLTAQNTNGGKLDNQTLKQWQGQGVTLSGAGVGATVQTPAQFAGILATPRAAAAAAVETNPYGTVQGAEAKAFAYPEDTEALTKAQRAVLDGMRASGMSWQQIANQTRRIAAEQGDTSSTTYKLNTAIAAYADMMQTAADSFKGPGQALTHQFGQFVSMTQETGPNAATDIQTGQQGLTNLQDQVRQEYQQRLMAQYQYEQQVHRSTFDFHRQEQRAEQDYQRQLTYTQQDYQRQRYRSVRDFNIQVAREVQDSAKTLYDPYTRIGVQTVFDAPNLIGNEREQITAMRQQLANINKLKSLGMTEQAIRQLSLYDPGKEQQVQELVDDLSGNRGEVRQLNQIAATRQQLGGQLLAQDPSFQRQKADFHRQLSDSAADYHRQTDRMHQEYQTALRRAAEDQHTALHRMAQDLKTADMTITGDMTTLQNDMLRLMNGQQVKWSTSMVDGLTSTITAVEKLAPKWSKTFDLLAPSQGQGGGASSANAAEYTGGGAGAGMSGPSTPGVAATGSASSTDQPGAMPSQPTRHEQRTNNPAANRATGRAMAAKLYGWTGAQWTDLNILWNNESGWSETAANSSGAYGIPQGIPYWHPDYAQVMHQGAAAQIAWGLGYIRHTYGDPAKALEFWNRTDPRSLPGAGPGAQQYPGHWYGAGAVFTAPRVIGVGEKGDEAVIPLDMRGVKTIAAALREYGGDELRMLSTGGRAASIVIHASYHYDQRADFTGAQITVEAQNPNEMAEKLAAKAAAARLTATRGVAWSRSR